MTAEYEECKKLGMCWGCKKAAVYCNDIYCYECYEKKLAYSRKYTKSGREKETKKALMERRRAEGLCVMCGKPAVEGKNRCQYCLNKARINTRNYRLRNL